MVTERAERVTEPARPVGDRAGCPEEGAVADFREKLLELTEIQGRTVRQCALRPDCRQLRVFLDDQHLLQVSAWIQDDGEPRLELDLLAMPGLDALAKVAGHSRPRRVGAAR